MMNEHTDIQVLLASPDYQGRWRVQESSTVDIATRTLWGLMPVHGTFGEVSGSGTVAADATAAGTLTLAAASVNTGNGKRDEHLRGPHFFDTDLYPEILVAVEQVRPVGGALTIAAKVTVRGTTVALNVPATVTELTSDIAAVTATFTLERTAFGMQKGPLGFITPTTHVTARLFFTRHLA